MWIDASHLVFFKKNCYNLEIFQFDSDIIDFEGIFDFESDKMELKMKGIFKGKCFAPRIGLRVFHQEYIAVKLMLEELKGKSQIPENLKNTYEQVIAKLAKADTLLAKISLFDAKNAQIQNPTTAHFQWAMTKFQKIVEYQIKLAEKELEGAEQKLQKGQPDKAISRLAKSWLHSSFRNF